jgi:hypothetical protein
MFDDNFDQIEKGFRATLLACRALYVDSAKEMVERYPRQLGAGVVEFATSMEDLHKGLVLKVVLSLVEADFRWTAPERRLTEVLFEHVWGQPVQGEALKEAALEVSQNLRSVTWFSLIKPFCDLQPLQAKTADLETIVMRLGNLVAKCDGRIASSEEALLRYLQNEIDSHLRPLRLDARRSDGSEPPIDPRATDLRGTTASAFELPDVKSNEIDLGSLLGGRGPKIAGSAAKPGAAKPTTDKPRNEKRKSSDDDEEDEEDEKPKPQPVNEKKPTLQESLAELEALIGLNGIKKEIRTLVNYLDLQRKREEAGLPKVDLTLHMCFNGNPGTGKTTVARIVGKIFQAMNILAKGHLVETDRSGLVAKYAGQTGPRTHKRIDEALDGILFIDEAYTLSMQSNEDVFGQEALQALVKRMEDDRNRIAVILAGYSGPMKRMLQVNPGLTSRIATQLEFPDYTPEELGRIFESMCKKNQYTIPAASRIKLLRGFRHLYDERDEHFGNGRAARNVFEDSIRRLANRIVGITPITKELLTTLEVADIEFDGISDEWFDEAQRHPMRVRVKCPKCAKVATAPAQYLGKSVSCNKCKAKFELDWGEPVISDEELTAEEEADTKDGGGSPNERELGDPSPDESSQGLS